MFDFWFRMSVTERLIAVTGTFIILNTTVGDLILAGHISDTCKSRHVKQQECFDQCAVPVKNDQGVYELMSSYRWNNKTEKCECKSN